MLALLVLSACVSTAGSTRSLSTNRLSTFQVTTQAGSHGSGVVLANADDGAYVLTCSHVIHDKKGVRIGFTDRDGKRSFCHGKVVIDDPGEDLAVVKFDCRFPQTVTLGKADATRVADRIYNVGYPYDFGEMYGEGFVQKERFNGIILTPNGLMLIKDTILAHIPDGAGTSGSGVFDAASSSLIGIMEGAMTRGDPIVGVTVRLVIPMSRVRPFLDKHKIPYSAIDDK
jgi:S1-C subfamily serine protease